MCNYINKFKKSVSTKLCKENYFFIRKYFFNCKSLHSNEPLFWALYSSHGHNRLTRKKKKRDHFDWNETIISDKMVLLPVHSQKPNSIHQNILLSYQLQIPYNLVELHEANVGGAVVAGLAQVRIHRATGPGAQEILAQWTTCHTCGNTTTRRWESVLRSTTMCLSTLRRTSALERLRTLRLPTWCVY